MSELILLLQTDEVSSSSPLGTILPWVPRPSPSLAASPLPDGWLPCDGSTIPKGPWAGGKTPDLNSAGLFLRGGEEAAVLEVEEDQVQEHEHKDPGHGHSCSATSTAQPHTHHIEDNTWWAQSTHTKYLGSGDYASGHNLYHDTEPLTVTVETSCSTSSQPSGLGGVAPPSNSGTETRPRNMKVLYVMRCW